MPREEAIFGEWAIVVAGSVEHHVDDAFDVTIGGFESADIEAEMTRDRRADLLGVEFFALDGAALEDVVGESLENGLLLEGKAEMFHLAKKTALAMADRGKQIGQGGAVPVKVRPTSVLVDVG
jgi:hypothetical protein